jgi:hypothetical protein
VGQGWEAAEGAAWGEAAAATSALSQGRAVGWAGESSWRAVGWAGEGSWRAVGADWAGADWGAGRMVGAWGLEGGG